MPLKKRVGTFFIFTGGILLFVFFTSVFTPTHSYEVTALIAGAVLLGLGWTWRASKASGSWPPGRKPAASAPPPPRPAAAKGAPKGGPKKQSPVSLLLKGPPPRKTAPAPKPGGGGGKPPGKKKK